MEVHEQIRLDEEHSQSNMSEKVRTLGAEAGGAKFDTVEGKIVGFEPFARCFKKEPNLSGECAWRHQAAVANERQNLDRHLPIKFTSLKGKSAAKNSMGMPLKDAIRPGPNQDIDDAHQQEDLLAAMARAPQEER